MVIYTLFDSLAMLQYIAFFLVVVLVGGMFTDLLRGCGSCKPHGLTVEDVVYAEHIANRTLAAFDSHITAARCENGGVTCDRHFYTTVKYKLPAVGRQLDFDKIFHGAFDRVRYARKAASEWKLELRVLTQSTDAELLLLHVGFYGVQYGQETTLKLL